MQKNIPVSVLLHTPSKKQSLTPMIALISDLINMKISENTSNRYRDIIWRSKMILEKNITLLSTCRKVAAIS